MTQIHLNPEILNLLFTIVNTAVLPSWLLLAFAPRWTYTRRFVLLCGVLLMAVTYTVIFAANFSAVMGGGGMSLAGISAGFQNPEIALLGWVHYLSFDMFVGAWEVHDAQTHEVPHWIVVPCLLGTFMAGPVGLLLYMAMRFVRTKQIA